VGRSNEALKMKQPLETSFRAKNQLASPRQASLPPRSADKHTAIVRPHCYLNGESLRPHGFDLAYFGAQTTVLTQRGEVCVAQLTDLDQVFTLDSGLRPISHKFVVRIDDPDIAAPICIEKGALKNRKDLIVSPNHQILIRDWQAELLFGDNEVLMAAKYLVNGSSIRQLDVMSVDYVGLVFMEHHLIMAEGIPCETLDIASVGRATGPMGAALPQFMIHPSHKNTKARRVLHANEAELLIETMKVGHSLPSWAA